jgi:imidazole glycerol phosphate synthase glutamine amidotransferase subunit
MTVGILALGAANSRSVIHALHRAGADSVLLERPEQLPAVCALVLPGVANLGYMIEALDRGNWRAPILAAIDAGLPTLGICAGFQLLCTRSEEAPGLRGLGIFSGAVTKLVAEKLPHMGWSRVEATSSAFESGWAYFAHSYAPPAALRETLAISQCGGPFAATAGRGNVIGVQFHPERSGEYGAHVLQRFVRMALEPIHAG